MFLKLTKMVIVLSLLNPKMLKDSNLNELLRSYCKN